MVGLTVTQKQALMRLDIVKAVREYVGGEVAVDDIHEGSVEFQWIGGRLLYIQPNEILMECDIAIRDAGSANVRSIKQEFEKHGYHVYSVHNHLGPIHSRMDFHIRKAINPNQAVSEYKRLYGVAMLVGWA